MYLSKHIDMVFESLKPQLLGRHTYKQIANLLTEGFNQYPEPFYFGVRTHLGMGETDFAVSGIYDSIDNKRYVVLNFSRYYRKYNITLDNWKFIKFGLSQVCQHEAIHQHQWQHRDSSAITQTPLDFRRTEETIDEVREYLADPDEIDAYAHDIAMEIRFWYPKQDYHTVLRHLTRKRKVWSYNYYRNTFRGSDWTDIKKRLLKKTFKWLPYV